MNVFCMVGAIDLLRSFAIFCSMIRFGRLRISSCRASRRFRFPTIRFRSGTGVLLKIVS